MKNLLLLDVDGVLNPERKPPNQPEWFETWAVAQDQSYRVLLNPGHGPLLLALAEECEAELVWATTWCDLANEEIGPRIGLPRLPVIDVTQGPPAYALNEKTWAVAQYVERRPFVWFDDYLTRADSTYLKEHDGVGAFSIVHVGPRYGLTVKHLDLARRWFAGRREVAAS